MIDFASRRTVMVDTQVRPSDVTKYPIIEAMLAVPREAYVPEALQSVAYVGEHVRLAPGRVVMDPRVLAKMLDALDIQPHETVLDLGCGLGYSTAVIARLAEAVVAVEEDADFAARAQQTLSSEGVDNAAVMAGPMVEGAAKAGPYDVIVFQGGVERMPAAIEAQLKDGGRIGAIFMTGKLGTVKIGHKIDGAVTWRAAFNATAPVLPGFAIEPAFSL